jgi:TetR/AcrR family transcriptional regulator, transcriptional repressor of bet genes
VAMNEPIRSQRRQELIRATIAVIARCGYSGTTVARVAEKAGVSVGLMNFHFDSKDRLFEETFRHLAEEYEQVWRRHLEAAPAEASARVRAMIECYFDRRVFTREKLAVWFTFWSDAELRDRYRMSALRVERRYLDALEQEIARLAPAGGRAGVEAILGPLSAMIDGYWLQAMLYPQRFDRAAAVAACIDFLELRLAGSSRRGLLRPAAALARARAAG